MVENKGSRTGRLRNIINGGASVAVYVGYKFVEAVFFICLSDNAIKILVKFSPIAAH